MITKLQYLFRRILLHIFSLVQQKNIPPSKEAIDIIIPVVEKDLTILPLCLEGVRRNVNNRVQDIYIVAPRNCRIESFCKENGCCYIDEESVLRFAPRSLNLIINDGMNRSGWLFQQLLKMSGNIGSCNNFLCIDADHVLIQPHTFLAFDSSPVFYMSSEMHIPYYEMIKRISSIHNFSLLSYVSHKMLFNKEQLRLLHSDIEKNTGKIWYQGIYDNYDRQERSGFSEFELYGSFVKNKHYRPWKQCLLNYEDICNFDDLVSRFGSHYNSLTFPEYINNTK